MGQAMTESELLSELQAITARPPPDRDGFFTTEELAVEMSRNSDITIDAARRRVLKMWHAAKRDGRLAVCRVEIEALDRRMYVQAYKLKSK